MMIDFTTIEQGESSCYRSVCTMLIVNSEQWRDFWIKNDNVSFWFDDYLSQPKDRIPEIDFDHYNAIAVVAGEKPSTRYVTEILSVETSRAQPEDRPLISITFQCKIPQSVSLVGHAVTCPYHIIKIPRLDAEKVIFKEV
jgi:hypothetical protein